MGAWPDLLSGSVTDQAPLISSIHSSHPSSFAPLVYETFAQLLITPEMTRTLLLGYFTSPYSQNNITNTIETAMRLSREMDAQWRSL